MTQAVYTFKMWQNSPAVILEGSGSINLAGLSFARTGNYNVGILEPSNGTILFGGASDFYSGVTGPSNFGPGGEVLGVNPIGNPVSIFAGDGQLGVPQGFVSGASLSNGLTFANATFASLGVTPGTYVWTWASGSGILILEISS
jgi:hypothetical protein